MPPSPSPSLSWRRRSLAGFTLIELLIVIVIIGILVAIAVPAYLRYEASANDRDAQAALQTAYKAAVAGDTEVNSSRFPAASTVVNDVKADEPAANVVRGDCYGTVANAPVKQVLVDPSSTSTQITMCVKSASGAIWRLTGPLTGTPTVSDGSTVTLQMSGNEISAAVRAAGMAGDGLPASDSSTGVWEASENLALNSSYDTTSYWAAQNGSDAGGSSDGAISFGTDPSLSVNGGKYIRYTLSTIHFYAYLQNALYTYWSSWPGGSGFDTSSKYTVSFWARDPNNSGQTVAFKISDGTSTNVVMTAAGGFAPTSTWQRFSFTFTPATAGNIPVFFFGNNTFRGTVDIAGLQLEKLGYATPYMPSSTSAYGSRNMGRIQFPASLLTAAQGWVAFRARMDVAQTQLVGFKTAFSWFAAVNNLIMVQYRDTGPNWKVQVNTPPANQALAQTSPGAGGGGWSNAGDYVTVVAYWNTTTVAISLNGSTFFTVPNTAGSPTGMPAVFDLASGGTGAQPNLDMMWFACGTGAIGDSDAATMNSWGNNDPKRSSFPAAAQATAVWDGASSTASLK